MARPADVAAWNAAVDGYALVKALFRDDRSTRSPAVLRKFVLLGCANSRRVGERLNSDPLRQVIDAAERHADAGDYASDEEMYQAIRSLNRWAAGHGLRWAVERATVCLSGVCLGGVKRLFDTAPAEDEPYLTAVVRDLFPDPSTPPVKVPKAWRTPAVLAVARGCYDAHAFDRLPVLADALEDAGCDSEPLLAHLRGPGPHVRGCWALDAVLGL